MLVKRIFGLGLFLGPIASAIPLQERDDAPTVSVKNGTYAGVRNVEHDQDFFLGVPYAKKPERFSVAESLQCTWDEVRTAEAYPPHCLGYTADQARYETSEDCLYLNVIRPAGVEPDADLPVAVWIHGGGLVDGGTADKRYNLSFIVENSVELGTPVIGVSFNYRLDVFGFLGGREAQEEGVTNIGFRDQRLALEWVQENIGAFGGDPDKVTIFGESSGAESVTAQVFAYNGRDDGLFRSAIGQSGFGAMLLRNPGGFNATDAQQETFDDFVRATKSCASTVGTPSALDCLRAAPLEELEAAIEDAPAGAHWTPVIDGDFIVDYSANQLARGNFARVPLLIGANSDEGTRFGTGVDTDEDMRRAVADRLAPDVEEHSGKALQEFVEEALHYYPDDQALGVPSLETWPHVIEPGDEYAEERGLQARRIAAFGGDVWMHYARRRANKIWSDNGIPSYAYCFNVVPYPNEPAIGSNHFMEVAFVFHNLDGEGYADNPFGGDDPEYTEKAKKVAKTMSTTWINFIVSQDPNGEGDVLSEAWPVYDSAQGSGVGREVVFDIDGDYVEEDDFRADGIDWLIENDLHLFAN